jgi:iron complex transport system substrate-binding protein
MSLKIVSFLPSATEMVYALGLEDQLVGVSHECDYPLGAKTKPVVVRNALDLEKMSLPEIDRAVSERIGSGGSLYQVDEELIRKLNPDLVLTQDLCQVCAPSGNEVSQTLKSLPKPPSILWMTPRSLVEIQQNMRDLGVATRREAEAEKWISSMNKRFEKTKNKTRSVSRRPRVFCMEWIDPIYCSGHWVPEMVEMAGGEDRLGRKGTDSVRVTQDEVLAWNPEILIVLPCGFHLDRASEQARTLLSDPAWKKVTAVQRGTVYAVDASSYFARPGPRVVEGTELLAHLIHPGLFPWNGPSNAFQKVAV